MITFHKYVAPILIGLILFSGCYVNEEYPSYTILQMESPGSIRLMTKDTVLYYLSSYSISDSTIQGEGTRSLHGVSQDFRGGIPQQEIVYVQGREFSFFRTLSAGVALGAAIYLIGTASKMDGLTVWRPYSGPGSCPYVYAWDGNTFQIQGESFGTAFGKALESSTSCMLPAATPQDGIVRVQLTNERPETHYVNNVTLFSCQAPAGSTVMLDADQRPWPVVHPLPPLRAPDEIRQKDGIFWKSDLVGTAPGAGFRDTVELTVPRPLDATEGSLIIQAINTELINAVYDIVFRYLGDQSLPFIYEVEHNQELITRLKEWITECSLTVEVWDNGKWASAGVIPPEANNVPFSKIIRVTGTESRDEELRLRLTTLADVWAIDAVEIDWTPARPLDASAQTLLSANHNVSGNAATALRNPDRQYSVMFPGESIDVAFSASPVSGDAKAFYFLKVGGYLYEALPEEQSDSVPFFFASFNQDRVQTVCNLLDHREVFLGLVYDRWREIRNHNRPVE